MNSAPFKMSLRNLSRNKRRNVATGFAIALGFSSALALGGFMHQAENRMRAFTIYGSRTGHIAIYKHGGLTNYEGNPKKYSLNPLDLAALERITAGMSQIQMQGPEMVGQGLVSNGCQSTPFFATAIDPQLDWKVQQHPYNLEWNGELVNLARGRELWEYPDDATVMAISSPIASFLHKDQPGDPPEPSAKVAAIDCQAADAKDKLAADLTVQLAATAWNGRLSGIDADVVANMRTSNPLYEGGFVRLPFKHLQRLYETKNATSYSIWLKDNDHVPETVALIEAKTKAAGLNLDVYSWDDKRLSPYFNGTMQFCNMLAWFTAAILASIVILSVFNSATMTVIERGSEIGMMRSLGFTRRRVRVLFVIEMTMIAAVSMAAGGLIGAVSFFFVNRAGIALRLPGMVEGMTLRLVVNPQIVLLSATLIFVLAIFASLLAVWAVAKNGIAALVSGSHR